MRIIGPPSATPALVMHNLMKDNPAPRFVGEIFPPLWDAAQRLFIDPVGVIAQAYKETGGGTFTRKVKPWFYNTGGIQIRHKDEVTKLLGTTDPEHPLLHAMFPSWEAGALAHVQHLRGYAGWPVTDMVVDPRYVYVVNRHQVENFEELGGTWAPSPTYGTELVAIARRLQSA
jgi:hypothetical protein